HYYQFNIGDYTSHTSHLDPLEDIAYRRMLDWVYLHESPLPLSVKQISKYIRMRDECERIADVLNEFFHETEYGYAQKKAEQEIAKFKDKSKKARKAVEARWAKKPNKPHTDVLQTKYERNTNHKPLTKNHKPIKDSRFAEFWNAYGKKTDAKKCKLKWNRLKESEKDKIFSVLTSYVNSTPERQFRKNPLTWLNGEGWNDEIEFKPHIVSPIIKTDKQQEAERVQEWKEKGFKNEGEYNKYLFKQSPAYQHERSK
ncbi:MAG: YdaU family protein, partial [Maribacter sp.]|nr:YdaU family protein [Maribacter sp.]